MSHGRSGPLALASGSALSFLFESEEINPVFLMGAVADYSYRDD
jgi:hypothetical protein